MAFKILFSVKTSKKVRPFIRECELAEAYLGSLHNIGSTKCSHSYGKRVNECYQQPSRNRVSNIYYTKHLILKMKNDQNNEIEF